MTRHTLQILLEERLGEPLEPWIEHRRTQGQSWRSLASELRMVTEIEVTDETLRRWYGPTH